MSTEDDWIAVALASARPRTVAALYRYFRDLDIAEEAFQDASLRALVSWRRNGPPRDAVAWLILVGRNTGVDSVRKRARLTTLPGEERISDREDAEASLVERLDESHYRDDILRLLFVCAHPELPVTQQIALALRIVSGLSVRQIARAFMVSEAAMEQRITRAKGRIARSGAAFETPDAVARTERLGVVIAMVYLVFNEGYSSASPQDGGTTFAAEAIRLARLLAGLFPAEPEVMALLALMLLHHARERARFGPDGAAILLDEQDRTLWNHGAIAEGVALLDKALRHRRPGPLQVQAAIAAIHARAPTPAQTDWREIEALYRTLEILQPSPVVTLNRAVAVSRIAGPQAALDLIEPLSGSLANYFYFHGFRGSLLMDVGRCDDARIAFHHAIARASTAAEAMHIRNQLDRLNQPSSHDSTR